MTRSNDPTRERAVSLEKRNALRTINESDSSLDDCVLQTVITHNFRSLLCR